MALNLLPFRILGTDKLRTGFRAKYNLLLNKVIKDWRIETDVDHPEYGWLYLITHDDTEIPLDMTGVYYTKEVIDSLINIGPATEEEAGIIRIATIEEAFAGDSDNTVITPYKLWLVLQYHNARTAIAGEGLLAGDFVYIYVDPEAEVPEEEPLFPVLTMKKAIATSELTLAVGFVEDDVTEGDETLLKLSGNVDTYSTGLAPNTYYYLSDTIPGALTPYPPLEPGSWQQILGCAISTVELMFEPNKGWLNWAPIYDNIPSLYFFKGLETTASVELPPLLFPYNQVEELDGGGFPVLVDEYSYRFLLLPDWITEHTVVFGTMAIKGQPTSAGTHKFFLEITDKNKRTWFQEFQIISSLPPVVETELLDLTTFAPILLGPIPGSYFVPDRTDAWGLVDGSHDKYFVGLGKGGVGSTNVLVSDEHELAGVVNSGAYRAFEVENGSALDIGLYYFEVATFIGILETARVRRYFTLFDETTKNQVLFELWNTDKIGDVSIQGITKFKYPDPEWFKDRIVVTDLPHDKITITSYLEGVQVAQRVVSVVAAYYDLYTSPQTGQSAGNYITNVKIELSGDVIFEAQVEYEILPKDIEPSSGIILFEGIVGTENYTEIQEITPTGVTVNLPEGGFGFVVKDFGAEIDYFSWEIFQKNGTSFNKLDISPYTKKANFKSYTTPVTEDEVLLFWGLTSLDIGSIHKAPSTFRVKGIGRIGGANGEVVSILQGDVTFRVPVDDSDLTGLRFINVHHTTGEIIVIDANMPVTGGVYPVPVYPWLWSVSFRKLKSGLEFDNVSMAMAQNGVDLHNAPYGTDVVDYPVLASNGYPGDVTTELRNDVQAYIFGTLSVDHRTLLNPANSPINIDVPSEVIVVSSAYRLGSLMEIKSTSFSLVDPEDIPDTEEGTGDCCEKKEWPFTAVTEFAINHNLGFYPDEEIFIDSRFWKARVVHIDLNNLLIKFSRPRTGVVFLPK